MTSSRILLASVLGIGCLAASGVGGYLAVKSGGVDASAGTPAAHVAPVTVPQAAEAASLTPAGVNESAPVSPEPPRPASRPARIVSPAEPTAPTRNRTASVVSERSAASSETAAAPEELPDQITPELPTTPAEAPMLADAPVARLPDSVPAPVETLIVERDAVIGIRTETEVSSETAKVEDRVLARVTRDVRVDDVTAIPAGARLEGSVVLVEQGGKFRDRARIGVRFTSVVLDDAGRIPIDTETIFRDGEPPTGEATSKIGASAVVGTILGAMIGGKKGAAIGGTAGAAGGTAAVMAGGRNEAVIAAGTALTVRLSEPLSMTIVPEP